MNKKARTRKFTGKQSARLGAYLAAGLGASTVATPTADAAIVNINIGPTGFNIGGINGGLNNGVMAQVFNFPFSGGGLLRVYNNYSGSGIFGLFGRDGVLFAVNGGTASPRNFALNATINNSASFAYSSTFTSFKYGVSESPDFGPGSYMGFKTTANNFGWLEVTWSSNNNQFQILSGAYESTPGVAILAGQGAGPAAVPEPGTWAAAALLVGGATYLRWRRRRDDAQKEAA